MWIKNICLNHKNETIIGNNNCITIVVKQNQSLEGKKEYSFVSVAYINNKAQLYVLNVTGWVFNVSPIEWVETN